MRKIIIPIAAAVSVFTMSFVSTSAEDATVTSITDPFEGVIEICYNLPEEGSVEIAVYKKGKRERVIGYSDKQGHGTHCAGLAVPPDAPGSTYTVDFAFEGSHQIFTVMHK